MRLVDFLLENEDTEEYTEEQIIETLKKDCSKFLREFRVPFFRGMNKTEYFFKTVPRTDRHPMSLRQDRHEAWNDMFKEKFGWKVRSEGVFATNVYDTATIYGHSIYAIFPTNGYKYVWSGNIRDLYAISSVYIDLKGDELYAFISNNYSDEGLGKKGYQNNEVVFKCKSYYALFCGADDNDHMSTKTKNILDKLNIDTTRIKVT